MKLGWLEKEAIDRNSTGLVEKDAPPVKVFWEDQVFAVLREATPLTLQLILTKPLEAVLEMAKELASKDSEATWL